jgi:signal transduction histidine kinase
MVADIVREFGRIDAVVNNARSPGRLQPTDADPVNWVGHNVEFEYSVKAVLNTVYAARPFMKAQGAGRIVNIGSSAWNHPWTGEGDYAAGKAGMLGISRVLVQELGPEGITINTDIPEALPEVEADGERLKQVLNNLLSNAIKFSNGGSRVTVRSEAKNGELMVRVNDQGIGVPEEAMKHLFERFYRATDTARVGGTGLGLYISKQIVEAHGGYIWAESKVGEGSTFSFALPLIQTSGDFHE